MLNKTCKWMDRKLASLSSTVSLHKFNLQIYNLRVSNPRIISHVHFKVPFESSNLSQGLGPFFQIELWETGRITYVLLVVHCDVFWCLVYVSMLFASFCWPYNMIGGPGQIGCTKSTTINKQTKISKTHIASQYSCHHNNNNNNNDNNKTCLMTWSAVLGEPRGELQRGPPRKGGDGIIMIIMIIIIIICFQLTPVSRPRLRSAARDQNDAGV